ncbi:MAG: FtsX-like permease family protein [Myxococcota bacterium]
MSFEHLIFQSALANKRRLALSVLGLTLCCLSFAVISSALPQSWLSLLSSFLLSAITCASAWSSLGERVAMDRVLFSVGFSREQIQTLLIFEYTAQGGVAALLAIFLGLALRGSLGAATQQLLPAAHGFQPSIESLSTAFIVALLSCALGALWPASRITCTEPEGSSPT